MASEDLRKAIEEEGRRFEEVYQWLVAQMPKALFEEVPGEDLVLITHTLMGLHLQQWFSIVRLKHRAVVLLLDSADADMRVLSHFRNVGVKHYRSYLSTKKFEGAGRLRISTLYFTEAVETTVVPISEELNHIMAEHGDEALIKGMNTRFLASLKPKTLRVALEMYERAKSRDQCQYEVHETDGSFHIIFGWKNVPKYDFLFRLARLVFYHDLRMVRFNATYIDPYSRSPILVMALVIEGKVDLEHFLREMVTLKYFSGFQEIVETFFESRLLPGDMVNLLRSAAYHVHQCLVNIDIFRYSLVNIEEAFCRHPELTAKICRAFEAKFDPKVANEGVCEELLEAAEELIGKLDTGHPSNDERRKNILTQLVSFVRYCLKTNLYRHNKTAFSFRLDPAYMDHLPYEWSEFYPERPFAIFFIKGMHFIGYHIRFRDLARGGLRTVFPATFEEMRVELNHVFNECYGLAYTQQKKNKDIPEGGSKAVIFLKPYTRLHTESEILTQELMEANLSEEEIEQQVQVYLREQGIEYVHQTQRAFVSSLLALINCEEDGRLKAKGIIDYYKAPEYLYLGPDERMADETITWIAELAAHFGYKAGRSFITSKPHGGINHKEYGVTSLGVNVYLEEVLAYLKIDRPYTIKISGGPDGDVAGNQILNLRKYHPQAKLIALTDVSGTIYDPEGLNLEVMSQLFEAARPISYYPPQELHPEGFLLDRRTVRDQSTYVQQTLLWQNRQGLLCEEWLSSSEANHLFQLNVHQTPADIFIPAGGRPRTLHAGNIEEFCDESGRPTARAIVEGANLYLTPEARRFLEERGTLVIRDASANKCGVIASSLEVLCGLLLTTEQFLEQKETLIAQILDRLKEAARHEARLLLDTHAANGTFLSELTEQISYRINLFTDQLREKSELDRCEKCLRDYMLPLLKSSDLSKLPISHRRAIIACHIAANLVYKRGLDWWPSVTDILPLVTKDPDICDH